MFLVTLQGMDGTVRLRASVGSRDAITVEGEHEYLTKNLARNGPG